MAETGGTRLSSLTPLFIVRSLADALAWYGSLGFETTLAQPPDEPFFAAVRRDEARLFLKEIAPGGELPPELARLVRLGSDEGFRFMARLAEAWADRRNRFDGPGEVLFLARLRGELVGVGGLNRDPYQDDPSVGRVRHLYVVSAARGRGVGERLLREIVAAARPAFRVLRLSTRQAGRFYERRGFVRIDEPKATHRLDWGHAG